MNSIWNVMSDSSNLGGSLSERLSASRTVDMASARPKPGLSADWRLLKRGKIEGQTV